METSMFNPDDEEINLFTDEQFVACGATSICYKQIYYGKWLLQKNLRKEFINDEKLRLAFKKEFEIGFQLDHPNIVRYINIHDKEDELYILTDYVDGSTLDSLIQEKAKFLRQLTWQRQFANELLSAIDYLHQRQILHLDLKPDNIMITNVGHHVKLIDLGFSYQDCYPQNCGGSPRYSAPELFESAQTNLSPASDIYSIGRIFHEMHIGKKSIINKCLEKDPAKRYQSILELKNSINSQKVWNIIYAILFILFALIVSEFTFDLFPFQNRNEDIANNLVINILSRSSSPVIVSIKAQKKINLNNIKQWGILFGEEKGLTIRNSKDIDWDNGNHKDIGIAFPTNQNIKATFSGDDLADINLRIMHLFGNQIYYMRPFVILNNSKILYGKSVRFKTSNFSRQKRKCDFANVYWDANYNLFDLQSDEIIHPDAKGNYTVYLSSNEDYKHVTVLHCKAEELTRYHFYKFKDIKNYKEWSNWHAGN